MADRDHRPLLRRLHISTPTSAQIVGFLTLLVSAFILLLLTGLTFAAAVTALVIFFPVILLTSPLWLPAAAAALATAAGVAGVAAVAVAATWMYRYWKGRRPVGSGGVDYARRRLAETAREVRDHAGFPRGAKDVAAPGA